MEKWKIVEMKDICTGIFEGPHATPKESQTGGVYLGIPAISDDGHINFEKAKRISEDDLCIWTKRVTPQEDDIVFTNEATLNLYAIIPAGFHGCLGRRLGLIRPNKDLVNVRYLFYYFFSPDWRETISRNKVSGATVERILMTKFPHFPVKLPPLSVQNRIASILSSIDEKITLNNLINHNLEAQADSLIATAIANNTVREVHLRDICSYVTEKIDCKTLNVTNYVSTDNMQTNRGGVGIASSIPDGNCISFRERDILVSNIRPYFKKIWRASFSGGCSNDVLCFRSINGYFSVLYHLLRTDSFFEYVMSGAKGSKMPRGDKQHIMNWNVPFFDNDILISLEGALETIDRRVSFFQNENALLCEIRDALLPNLMARCLFDNHLNF